MKPDVLPVGSQKYKVHKYPGDIDLFEAVQECCSLKSSSVKIAQRIQKIAKQIQQTPNVYWGDFKAGLDMRFWIDIGYKEDKLSQSSEYNPRAIRSSLGKLYDNKLLSEEEYTNIIRLVKSEPDLMSDEDRETLYDSLRKLYVLRWSVDDVINGYLNHRGKKIVLEDALTQPSIVKLDIWACPNGRYTEITNFFMLSYLDEQGKQHPVNIELDDRVDMLLRDIRKYSSKQHRKSLKYAKRLWLLSDLKRSTDIAKRLYPLFSSNAALLNQITSEIETLMLMTEKLETLPIPIIIRQVDEFKGRMNSIIDISFDEPRVYRLIDDIVQSYNSLRC